MASTSTVAVRKCRIVLCRKTAGIFVMTTISIKKRTEMDEKPAVI
jgi:hypothetical protein